MRLLILLLQIPWSGISFADVKKDFKTDVVHSLRFTEQLLHSLKDKRYEYEQNWHAHICYNLGVVEGELSGVFKNWRRNSERLDDLIESELTPVVKNVGNAGLSGISSRSLPFCTATVLDRDFDFEVEREKIMRRALHLENSLKKLLLIIDGR